MSGVLKHSGLKFAVIDVETTGFSRYDRIIEFACVTVIDGEVVDEYETLIQPDCHPGPVHVHGITPESLLSALKFETVASEIAARLNGAVLVAHNIAFDQRMLAQEAKRLRDNNFDPGRGICTYRLTGCKLAEAAARAGLRPPDHTALVDARCTAELLRMHASRATLRDLMCVSWVPSVHNNAHQMSFGL